MIAVHPVSRLFLYIAFAGMAVTGAFLLIVHNNQQRNVDVTNRIDAEVAKLVEINRIVKQGTAIEAAATWAEIMEYEQTSRDMAERIKKIEKQIAELKAK